MNAENNVAPRRRGQQVLKEMFASRAPRIGEDALGHEGGGHDRPEGRVVDRACPRRQ